jgi:hypothetical protein
MAEHAKELEQQSIFFPELRGKHHSQCPLALGELEAERSKHWWPHEPRPSSPELEAAASHCAGAVATAREHSSHRAEALPWIAAQGQIYVERTGRLTQTTS